MKTLGIKAFPDKMGLENPQEETPEPEEEMLGEYTDADEENQRYSRTGMDCKDLFIFKALNSLNRAYFMYIKFKIIAEDQQQPSDPPTSGGYEAGDDSDQRRTVPNEDDDEQGEGDNDAEE